MRTVTGAASGRTRELTLAGDKPAKPQRESNIGGANYFYIMNICHPCGITANYLTCLKKYGEAPIRPAFAFSTYHNGQCGVCKRETRVTEDRDFFYPDVSLIEQVKGVLHGKES